jgi:hypothetical protein
LKNYLFGVAYETSQAQFDQMEHRWSQLSGTLENFKQEEFLKVFWTSRHGRTQIDDIFEDVKEKYKESSLAFDLSIDLLEAAEQFVALSSPSDAVWSQYSQKSRELIGELDLLDSKQVRPVILAAIKRFNPAEFERLLRLLVTIIVRWQLIGEQRTGILEINCAKLAAEIWKSEISTASDALKTVEVLYLEDKSFQEKFAQKGDISNPKAIYLLKKIEQQERDAKKGASSRDLMPDRALTLEHILPKTEAPEWADVLNVDPKIVDDCALRIGNMCLLTGSRNREAARAPYLRKKQLYEETDLLTTSQAANYSAWNRDAIENRQQWLAARAVTVWRFT